MIKGSRDLCRLQGQSSDGRCDFSNYYDTQFFYKSNDKKQNIQLLSLFLLLFSSFSFSSFS